MTYIETEKAKESDDLQRVLYQGSRNIAHENGTIEEQIEEIEAVAYFNHRCSDPVFHGIISFRENEIPTKEQCEEAVEILLNEHNMSENQAIWVVHGDTDNIHIHVCANRIDPETLRTVRLEFYKKANERAARKIELAQGWERDNGHLAEVVINENGQKVVRNVERERRERDQSNEKTLSDKAQKFELRTGEKSAERLAKELAAEPLMSSKTWAEAHAALAKFGIIIQPKGSGGILIVRGQPVKLSTVSRKLSWQKLIDRLGEYAERDPAIQIQEREPESLDFKIDSREETLRKEFQTIEKAFSHKKQTASAELKKWSAAKKKEMYERHRKERNDLYQSRDWRGHGSELNAQRSILAYRHAQEKAALKEEIKKRRKYLRYEYGSTLGTYEEWLRRNDYDQYADIWRYRAESNVIIGEEQFKGFSPDFTLSLTPVVVSRDRKTVVNYCSEGRTKFVDTGSVIQIKALDNDTIREALRLAAEKWGRVTLRGSESFIRQAIILAVKEGIEIKNPECQKQIEEVRRMYATEYSNAKREREERRNRADERYSVPVKRDRKQHRANTSMPSRGHRQVQDRNRDTGWSY